MKGKKAAAIEECFPFRDTPSVTWINLDGIHEVNIQKIGKPFELYPLILGDILNTDQRPKTEELWMVAKKWLWINTDG